MSTDTVTAICSVCGETAPLSMTAECNWCDQRFHLNQRNDVEGKDCGAVWIDEQYMALQFACNTCLADVDRTGAAVPPAPRASGVTPAPRTSSAGEPRRRRYRRRA
jgi:hypothetical protein